MINTRTADMPDAANLRRLLLIRNIIIVGQIAAIVVVELCLQVALPLLPLALIIGGMLLFNLMAYLRLATHGMVTELEVLIQLLVDIVALTAMLYFTGGSTNPFISFYLLTLTVAAATLPRRHTWLIAAATVVCYSGLMFYYVPLASGDHQMTMGLHVFGMWVTFVLSAALISHFVVRMSASVRERDKALAQIREEALRNEKILALGILAAGAAHELGTPLATMAVLIRELETEHSSTPVLGDELTTLRQQVDACKTIISRLLANAGQARPEACVAQAADEFIDSIARKWQLLRPMANFKCENHGAQPAPQLVAEETLSQALINILNNAADASPASVEMENHWNDETLRIEIRDEGAGLQGEAAERAGEAFFTTKPPEQGSGVGLFLAKATIERFGGSLQMTNRIGGGLSTIVTLPLMKQTTQ